MCARPGGTSNLDDSRVCRRAVAWTATVLFSASAAAVPPDERLLFAAPFYSLNAGSQIECLAAGDLNGDRHIDLVVGRHPAPPMYGAVVTVFLGGRGGFSPTPVHVDPIGAYSAQAVGLGDFDADGVLDLAITHFEFGGYSGRVLLGRGDGTFGLARPIRDIFPRPIAIGDFNGDGRLDLASCMALYAGNGDGTFAPAQPYGNIVNPQDIASADFDADGALDLAIVDTALPGLAGRIVVLRGDGHGGFAVAGEFPVLTFPNAIALGDLDADGRLDMAVSNFYSATISLLFGRGDGTFAPQRFLQPGTYPQGVYIADVVGGAELDIVVGHFVQPAIGVLRGLGGGAFAPAVPVVTGSDARRMISVAFGGRQYLCVGHSGWSGGFPTIQDGGGVAVLPFADGILGVATYRAGRSPSAVVMSDLNRDRKQDVIVAHEGERFVSVWAGVGDGTLGVPSAIPTVGLPWSIVISDLDGDDIEDLAVGTSLPRSIRVFPGRGDLSFGPAHEVTADIAPRALVAADLDGDGWTDLAAANSATHTVALLHGSGAGSFPARIDLQVGLNPVACAVGDLDGDGQPDIVTACASAGGLSIYTRMPDGGYASRADLPTGDRPAAIAIGDLNGDPNPDLAVAHSGSGTVAVLLGRAGGTFDRGVDLQVGVSATSVVIADLDGDRRTDIAVTDAGHYDIAVFSGNGDGTFDAGKDFGTGRAPSALAAGFMNGDRFPDLVVVNRRSDDLAVLLNNGRGSRPSHTLAQPHSQRLRAFVTPPSVVTVAGDARTIGFELTRPERIDIAVYDVRGRRVREILRIDRGPGIYQQSWSAHDLATGVYLMRFQAGSEVFSRKLVVVR